MNIRVTQFAFLLAAVVAASSALAEYPNTLYPAYSNAVIRGQSIGHMVPVQYVEPASLRQPASLVSTLGDVPSDKMDKGKGKKVCPPPWAHRTGVFAEFLYLRGRDAEVSFASPFDGPIAPNTVPIQLGEIAVADPDYNPGYRVGVSWSLDECSSLVATYTDFESHTTQVAQVDPALVLRSQVHHPSATNAAADFLSATASSDIDFQMADVVYRAVWTADECSAVNYIIGARYAHMDQDFQSVFTLAGTTDFVNTSVNFDGAGFLLGIDGERHGRRGFLVYGRSSASFLAGEFSATYFNGSTADPVIVDTNWRAGSVVSILDLELGAGWQSPCGKWRLTGGYLLSTWFNTINTDGWINGVQANEFDDMNDSISFDGFSARAELRF